MIRGMSLPLDYSAPQHAPTAQAQARKKSDPLEACTMAIGTSSRVGYLPLTQQDENAAGTFSVYHTHNNNNDDNSVWLQKQKDEQRCCCNDIGHENDCSLLCVGGRETLLL